ncbi:hypothetical protein BDP27DRAFT_21283 [Rhodocollybia butyracea]|uniref:BZIP domain-containing protein n=1 Tax=Rhodocollybia butyracea TaxID=206335 RepID=A0A9P5UH55_9AGAR|nr:hypothetical protein BDP27DRAFT_21283 [Rhodocollybia butyracea]
MSDLSKPERSRNAKAQARHRAKRKAYIEQLEQTVTKLQTAMGVTPDQVAALPPPMAKIRELEQENTRLAKENDELRRLLSDSGVPITGPAASNTGGYGSPPNSFNGRGLQLNRSLTGGSSANGPSGAFHDTRNLTDSYGGLKRRKMSHELDSNYPSENTDLNSLRAPPPLTIPQHPSSHHYSSSHPSSHPSSQISSPHPNSAHPNSAHPNSAHPNSAHGPPSHHFNLVPPPPFQMPHTPSASSATSSPPFSASFSH